MIAYVKGRVAEVSAAAAVLEVGGIGYRVNICGRDVQALSGANGEVKLHTYFGVSQDAMRLYGFLSEDDLEIFKLLLNVSGVGPKAALGILSVLSANDLRFAVLSQDDKAIAKAPGIGKKSAQKVILELKDKFSLEDAFEKKLDGEPVALPLSEGTISARDEAVQALAALGYSGTEALRAVKKCEITDEMDVETILKLALRKMI